MRINLKKVMSGVAALAVAASVGPFISTPVAGAAAPGTAPNGSLSMTPSSGDSQQDFVLDPDDPQVCPGDGATDGYRWQTYFVDAANDPATLTYGSTGPNTTGTTGWVSALFTPAGSPVVNQNPDIGTANISGIPVLDFSVFGPGVVPAGEYYIGIACTLSGVTETFWQLPITITTNAGDGASNISYVEGWAPDAPTVTGAVPDTGECRVTFTPGEPIPGDSFRVEASLDGAGTWTEGTPGTGAASPLTVTDLADGTAYDVRVVAINTAGETVSTNTADCVPQQSVGPVLNLVEIGQGLDDVGDGSGSPYADIDWDAPAAVAGCTVSGYTVSSDPAGTYAQPSPITAADVTSARITGLPVNTTVEVIVTPVSTECVGIANDPALQVVIVSGNIVIQDIDATRPIGALVLTQVCGSNGLLPAEGADAAGATFGGTDRSESNVPGTNDLEDLSVPPLGFDRTGALPQIDALRSSAVGAPTPFLSNFQVPKLTEGGDFDSSDDQDTQHPEYPYPTTDGVATPADETHCGLDFGVADFVTVGNGAGQYFAADAAMNQVTIVDTRNVDAGWAVTGEMGDFSASTLANDGSGFDGPDQFSGDFVGWTPVVTEDTSAFDSDADGAADYDQHVVAGAIVNPNTPGGLGNGETLASADGGEGLGTAILDARIKLIIPVTADAGLYEGALRFSAA